MMKGKNGFSIYLLCHHSRNIDYFSTQTVNNMMVLGQIQLGLPFLSLSLSLWVRANHIKAVQHQTIHSSIIEEQKYSCVDPQYRYIPF